MRLTVSCESATSWRCPGKPLQIVHDQQIELVEPASRHPGGVSRRQRSNDTGNEIDRSGFDQTARASSASRVRDCMEQMGFAGFKRLRYGHEHLGACAVLE